MPAIVLHIQSKFGITLRVPQSLEIGRANALVTEQNPLEARKPSASVGNDMDALVAAARAMLGAATGGYPMLAIDQSIHVADAPAVAWIVDGEGSSQQAGSDSHVMGRCKLVRVDDEGTGAATLYPLESTR
ncbi:MAG TPA: hypothetical protein VFS47_17230 [Steroidobacteraceae bacterium]|nr:hypothetical protein [Steroidobacteraceae bacterium]